MREMLQVARREVAAFFSSSVAYLFIGAFLAVCLFIVFWVETFFARNLADVRPLFEWMPLLMIFLVAAVTMRMWSEERRAGTLETLMTTPVSTTSLVGGKFLACIALVVIALALTLPLPITVSFLGPLDWGPVIGGYVATIMLASAYAAIGLYISARTDNQIVSLIGTVLVGLVFYLPGSDVFGGLFGQPVSGFLDLIGTGSRFDSITRGVIDLRDLYYYISLAGIFLALNVLSLERLRWAGSEGPRHRVYVWMTALVILNLIAGDVWLQTVDSARIDMTQGNIYSISDTSRNYLHQLQEPLLIRGYFSSKTHPLLAPLVPQLKNLIREYAIAGGDNVHAEFVDPDQDQNAAQQAARRFGIKPVPFRNQSKYESSVVNSYFDVLIKYGDQYKVLNFRDLIAIKENGTDNLKVQLKDPEYELTSTVQKVVSDYKGAGNVFSSITSPVTLHGYISPTSQLPQQLVQLRKGLDDIIDNLQSKAGSKLQVKIQDPQAGNGKLAETINKEFGFQPMVASLFDSRPFYFYIVLQQGDQKIPVPLPDDLDKKDLKKAIQTGLKQFGQGMRKTVAVYTPPSPPGMMGMQMSSGPQFTRLMKTLRGNAVVKTTNLKNGEVPAGSQMLLVLAPDSLNKKQLFAIDQFMMRGGTVVIAASPYDVSLGRGGLNASPHKTGLEKWLAAKGISLKKTFVMDSQNSAFPVPVYRNVGGLRARELYPMDYPYFPYISGKGLAQNTPATTNLQQLTLSWASPIDLDKKKTKGDQITTLLRSSPDSWVSDSTDITPQIENGQPVPYEPQGKQQRRTLAVSLEGKFDSFFKGKPNPLLAKKPDQKGKKADKKSGKSGKGDSDNSKKKAKGPQVGSVIDHSPAATRLIVIGSDSFARDTTLKLIGSGTGSMYDQPIHFVQNLVDWSLENPGLLALRGKTGFSRLLKPMTNGEQHFWEYLNYGLALLGLFLVWLIARILRARRDHRYQAQLTNRGV